MAKIKVTVFDAPSGADGVSYFASWRKAGPVLDEDIRFAWDLSSEKLNLYIERLHAFYATVGLSNYRLEVIQ